MKKFTMLSSVLVSALMVAICTSAQTAKQVLDKTAAALSNKGGVTANFTVTGKSMGSTSGRISALYQCLSVVCWHHPMPTILP